MKWRDLCGLTGTNGVICAGGIHFLGVVWVLNQKRSLNKLLFLSRVEEFFIILLLLILYHQRTVSLLLLLAWRDRGWKRWQGECG